MDKTHTAADDRDPKQPTTLLLCHLTVGSGDAATDIALYGSISLDGDLVIAGQDVGAAPKAWFDDSDYEYWLVVRAPDKDRVLLELLKERFGGKCELGPIRAWLEARSIPGEFSSY